MPHIPLPQLVFLCVVVVGFALFMGVLLYVSVEAIVIETRAKAVTREVTPAQRGPTVNLEPTQPKA